MSVLYKADIANGKSDQLCLDTVSILIQKRRKNTVSSEQSFDLEVTFWQFTHLAAGLEALDVDAEVVVGVVGQGGVGVEERGHGGRIQVARVGVHLQLQLGALWLPVMVITVVMTVKVR